MKTLSIYGLLTLLSSCTSMRETLNVVGTYKYEERPSRDYGYVCQIVLLKDSTFEYSEDGHMVHSKSSGKWNILGDSLTLSSHKQYGIVSVTEHVDPSEDSIRIQVNDVDGIPLAGAILAINEPSNSILLDQDGTGHMRKQPLETILLSSIDLGKHHYFPKDEAANYFEFVVMLRESSYQYFTAEKWGIKNRGLVRAKDFVLKKTN